MNHYVAERATRAFIAAARREWTKAHPGRFDCPIGNLDEYDPANQIMLRRAIWAAVVAASQAPGGEQTYQPNPESNVATNS